MRIPLQSINQSFELQVNYVEHGQHMPGISVYALFSAWIVLC